MDDAVAILGAVAVGQSNDLAIAVMTRNTFNTPILGVETNSQPGVLMVMATRALLGRPQMIFDTPQVVSITYQANTAYTGVLLHNDPINRTDFRLVQGVTNEVYFVVRDQACQPVIGNLTLTLRQPDVLLLQCPLPIENPLKGRHLLTLLPSDVAQLPLGFIQWSVSYQRADLTTVVLWTEHNSPYSTALVLPSPIPEPPTQIIPWSAFSPLTAPPSPLAAPAPPLYYTAPLPGAAQQPYTDGIQVFVFSMTGFTGTIRVDAALTSQPSDSASNDDWFTVNSTDYTLFTGDDLLSVQGCFLWTRIVVTTPMAGSLDQVRIHGPPPPMFKDATEST